MAQPRDGAFGREFGVFGSATVQIIETARQLAGGALRVEFLRVWNPRRRKPNRNPNPKQVV